MVMCFCGNVHNTLAGFSLNNKSYLPHPPSVSLAKLGSIIQQHKSHNCTSTRELGLFVYNQTMAWIRVQSICLHHLTEAIYISSEASKWLFTGKDPRDWLVAKVRLGVNVAEAVANRMVGLQARVTQEWESILWTMVSLITCWDPQYFGHTVPSQCLKFWVLSMFTSHDACPNVHLRLEFLRLFQMWSEVDIAKTNLGVRIARGLTTTLLYLQLDNLMVKGGGPGLAQPLAHLLDRLTNHGHLRTVAEAAISQVKDFKLGNDARCLVHLVELASQMARKTQEWYEEGHLNALAAVTKFNNALDLLQMLVTESPTMEVFESPGLAQIAAAALVTVTSSFLNVASKLMSQKPKTYRFLFLYIDMMYERLTARKSPKAVSVVLKREHMHALFLIRKATHDKGISFVHLSALFLQGLFEERTESCPERFLDSVTQAVMEAPVLLHSSKMVVDESTLIHLLLTSPSDPFTRCPLDSDTYSRLPDLQDDIVAWRKNNDIDSSYVEDSEDVRLTRDQNRLLV
ncbi:E4 ubiquitin-protein ligase UFD2-like 5 [Homarus americanus]|uniref:E4 ubiquitin-protein ligase UFD2-like 5 n=1 Tax=Homarus americanus TaxID=6706 RepID=A0A8J5JE64_HOMAM|nr:E4 ubiquitin-protein ligase UFD2-like 5 [Homarus americanus]